MADYKIDYTCGFVAILTLGLDSKFSSGVTLYYFSLKFAYNLGYVTTKSGSVPCGHTKHT